MSTTKINFARTSRRVALAAAVSIGALSVHQANASAAAGDTAQSAPAAAPVAPALLPALPPVAATFDPISLAAADALWSLWFDDPAYDAKLAVVADVVGTRGKISPTLLHYTWEQTDRTRMIVLLSALTQVGVRYRHNASIEARGFDCSGLTSWAWSRVGVLLPRYSRNQIRVSQQRDAALAQPGDLLWYPGHVMMALGVGTAIVHSPSPGGRVQVRPMPLRRNSRLLAASPI